MDVEYQLIREKFEELRDYIRQDLSVLLKSQHGVNYTAALLIACACESLAWFRYGERYKGDKFLADMMLPSPWKPVARSLYDALRDGLAHAFETMNLVVGRHRFDIGVSWGRHDHLSFNPERSVLYLNVYTMAKDLEGAICRYEEELKTSKQARARFYETMREMKNTFVVDVSTNPRERPAWEELLK